MQCMHIAVNFTENKKNFHWNRLIIFIAQVLEETNPKSGIFFFFHLIIYTNIAVFFFSFSWIKHKFRLLKQKKQKTTTNEIAKLFQYFCYFFIVAVNLLLYRQGGSKILLQLERNVDLRKCNWKKFVWQHL